MDLCSIAETCSRFQQIAGRSFRRKLTLKKNGMFIVTSTNFHDQPLKERGVQRVVTNVGALVSDFSISENIAECRLGSLNGIFEQAVNRFEKLKRLQIYGFQMPAVSTEKLKKVMKGLELLELQWTCTSDATLFEGLDELTDLRLIHVENCGAILGEFFPKLQRFTFSTTIRHGNTDQAFGKFISRHNCLKALHLI